MKIWVITYDEVCDFENFPQRPIAFKDESEARKMMERIKEDILSDYADNLQDDDWVFDESADCLEVYEDGRYSENHFSAVLNEIEVQ